MISGQPDASRPPAAAASDATTEKVNLDTNTLSFAGSGTHATTDFVVGTQLALTIDTVGTMSGSGSPAVGETYFCQIVTLTANATTHAIFEVTTPTAHRSDGTTETLTTVTQAGVAKLFINIITNGNSAEARTSKMVNKINVYSFALKPEEHQPSGTCNFSRIDNANLIMTHTAAVDTAVKVYAVNYNVLRIMSGMGGLAYSN